jgi:hypothetical protein
MTPATDVAVWIPVVPRAARSKQGEAFLLLVLAGVEPSKEDPDRDPGKQTRLITVPRRFLSPPCRKRSSLISVTTSPGRRCRP